MLHYGKMRTEWIVAIRPFDEAWVKTSKKAQRIGDSAVTGGSIHF